MSKKDKSNSKGKKRGFWTIGRVISMLLIVILIAGTILYFKNPTLFTSKALQAQTEIIGARDKGIQAVTNNYPEITLNGEGDLPELRVAPVGTFVKLTRYEVPGVIPVYGAHNDRGGNVILNWKVGQKVKIIQNGTETVYVLAGDAQLYQSAHVSDLKQLRGDFALQSCYFTLDNRMRFVEMVTEDQWNDIQKGQLKLEDIPYGQTSPTPSPSLSSPSSQSNNDDQQVVVR